MRQKRVFYTAAGTLRVATCVPLCAAALMNGVWQSPVNPLASFLDPACLRKSRVGLVEGGIVDWSGVGNRGGAETEEIHTTVRVTRDGNCKA